MPHTSALIYRVMKIETVVAQLLKSSCRSKLRITKCIRHPLSGFMTLEGNLYIVLELDRIKFSTYVVITLLYITVAKKSERMFYCALYSVISTQSVKNLASAYMFILSSASKVSFTLNLLDIWYAMDPVDLSISHTPCIIYGHLRSTMSSVMSHYVDHHGR